MSIVEVTQKNRSQLFVSIAFVFLSIIICSLFLIKATFEAGRNEFWGDERNGLYETVRPDDENILRMLRSGVRGQYSRAPLDYIFLRVLDEIRSPMGSFGLPFNIYYRLISITSGFLSAMGCIFLAYFAIKKVSRNTFVFASQASLLLAALSIYLFWPFNFAFTIQMRPYALWNSVWFTVLILLMVREKFYGWVIFCMLLTALTASASIFQISSLAFCYTVVQMLNGEKIKKICKVLARSFVLPFIVSFYYAYLNPHRSDWNPLLFKAGFHDRYWAEFMRFWLAKEMIPLLACLGILFTFRLKQYKFHTIVFLTMLMLYIIAPITNFITLSHGVFFSSRYYIYFELIYPCFFISLAIVLPTHIDKLRNVCVRSVP